LLDILRAAQHLKHCLDRGLIDRFVL
jgi:hypothetical protein